MWIWIIIGIGLVAIIIGVGIGLFRAVDKESRARFRDMPIYYRCMHCGLPFIPSPGTYLPTCTNCGQTTNISGRKPFSQAELDYANWIESADKSQPETWILFAAELDKQGRYAEAMKCLETVGELPNVDEEITRMVAEMKKHLKKKRY